MIRPACNLATDEIDIAVFVDISAANTGEADLVERVQLARRKRYLRFNQLEIELTESAIMDQPNQALAMLRELAGAGI